MFSQIFVTLRDEKIDTNSKGKDRFSNWNSQSDPFSISERNPNFPPPGFPSNQGGPSSGTSPTRMTSLYFKRAAEHIIGVEVQASVGSVL